MIDRLIGDPDWLWKKLPHPVVVFGNMISFCEKSFNLSKKTKKMRFWFGCFSILVLICIAGLVGYIIHIVCTLWPVGGVAVEAIIASFFLAQKSLADHVKAVAIAFDHSGLKSARHAVSMIVGRDPNQLDESAITRAAIESLSENSSDGIIAPVFWFIVLGLPGLMAYKMLNTADSMIGHKNERYKDFGCASARLDDVANYIPARLSGVIAMIASFTLWGKGAAERAFYTMIADAHHHRSPNAGWPETAYAGALNIQMSGPRIYGGVMVDEPFQNHAGKVAHPHDIGRALQLFNRSMTLLTVFVGLIFCFIYFA